MADFNNLSLTFKGVNALLEAQAGKTLTLSKIGLGSGTNDKSIIELTDMVKLEALLPISEKVVGTEDECVILVARMTNKDVTEGFYWRETGLYFEDSEGNDVLFAYACVSDENKYDYVPPYSDQRYVKHVRIATTFSDCAEIVIQENSGLTYVDELTFEEFKIEYGKHVNTFEEHIYNSENPHNVTAAQLSAVFSTSIKEILCVDELPEDAAEHTDVLYVIPEK